jgi:hypothetical protein
MQTVSRVAGAGLMMMLSFLFLLATSPTASAAAPQQKWVQDVFGISDWVAPNPDGRDQFPGAFDAEAERRYAEYAAANFTVMLGSLCDAQYPGGPTPGNWSQTLEEQVVLAEKHGLRIIPSVATHGTIASGNATLIDVSERVASSKAFWGFDFFDVRHAAAPLRPESRGPRQSPLMNSTILPALLACL